MPDSDGQLKILQVDTQDTAGGAAKVAWNLFHAYRDNGHQSFLAVGWKRSDDPNVLVIPNAAHRSYRARARLALNGLLQPLVGKVRGMGRLQSLLRWVGEPGRWSERERGLEDFSFPGTWRLLDLTPKRPDIVHCHNLHGDYFDLRALPWLTHEVPVILTLHDAWLLGGHCAHSLTCERWRHGCGHCPNLSIYPSIRRDASAFNWKRKQAIYARSRFYLAAPSRWLMDKVRQSMLMAGAVDCRVIPNGVDLDIFHPIDKSTVRATLGIAENTIVLVSAAANIRRNPWKDYETMRSAFAQIAASSESPHVLLIALGEDAPPEHVGRGEIRFLPYQEDARVVASYYQAADVYVHAARAENHSLTICEAMACGTPVVATRTGGIPEQVQNGVTGLLTPPGDPEAMAASIRAILQEDSLRRELGENAARFASERFDVRRQVDEYLSWYREIHETCS